MVEIKGIKYVILRRYDASDLPNIRKRMNESDIKGYIYLRRANGKRTFSCIEYNNGKITTPEY